MIIEVGGGGGGGGGGMIFLNLYITLSIIKRNFPIEFPFFERKTSIWT